MRFIPRLIVVLLCCLPVLGQNIRWDSSVQTTTGHGQLVPVLAIPGAVINFYTGCTVLPCGTKATTYNAPTGSTACPSGQQVTWQLPLPQACTSTADSQGNFGGYFQPGAFQYTISIGSTTTGPYQFNVGGGGGGGSGVTSINTVSGAFTFNGGGVSCTSTTCTFSGGGGGGGVNPGAIFQIPYYDTTSTVHGDSFFTDTAPGNSSTGLLSYTGGGGANFTTNSGGSYNFTSSNSSFLGPSTASQINLSTDVEQIVASPNNPGGITISTKENAGNNAAANILIQTNNTITGGNSGGNINIQTIGGSPSATNNGNIAINALAQSVNGSTVSLANISGNVLIGNSGSPVNIVADLFSVGAPNFFVDTAGNVTANGNITTANHFNSAVLSSGNCLQADSSGNIVSAAAPCGSGGGGSIGGSGTVGFFPLWVTNTTTLGNSHLDEVTNAGFDTFSQGVIISDGTGVGGSTTGAEGTAPSAGTGVDTFYADSATHRWKQNPNNTGATIVNGIAAAGTSGHCVQLASNGIDLADSGAPCSVSPGTPTHVADSGAGTAGSLVVSFATGANDNAGYVNLTTGNSPAANAGVITVVYGGTYASARKCVVTPASALAQALGANGVFVPSSTSVTTQFVITIGTTALPANTTGYQWSWSCQN